MHKCKIYLSESRVCFGLLAFNLHHVQQTKPAPAASVHKQTAAQGSVHWAWSKPTSKLLVLACSGTTSLQWHTYLWLSLPHTPWVCFERPVLVTADRESSGAAAPSLSLLCSIFCMVRCVSAQSTCRDCAGIPPKPTGGTSCQWLESNLLNIGTSEVSKPTSSDCPWLDLVTLALLNPFVVAVH